MKREFLSLKGELNDPTKMAPFMQKFLLRLLDKSLASINTTADSSLMLPIGQSDEACLVQTQLKTLTGRILLDGHIYSQARTCKFHSDSNASKHSDQVLVAGLSHS